MSYVRNFCNEVLAQDGWGFDVYIANQTMGKFCGKMLSLRKISD